MLLEDAIMMESCPVFQDIMKTLMNGKWFHQCLRLSGFYILSFELATLLQTIKNDLM